jgi:hypothetical protein
MLKYHPHLAICKLSPSQHSYYYYYVYQIASADYETSF